MSSPVLDLIAANRTPPEVAANSWRADNGESFSSYLKDNVAAAERRPQTSLQREEMRAAEARERVPAVDRRERDDKSLDAAASPHRRGEQPAPQEPAVEVEATATLKRPATITDDRAETNRPTGELDATPVKTSDTKVSVAPTDSAFGTMLALVGATAQAPAAAATAGSAAARSTGVAEANRIAQSIQPPKTAAPVPRATVPAGNTATIPAAAQPTATVQAKASVVVTVANQDPLFKPAAAPVIEEAQSTQIEAGKPPAIAAATTAKVASNVVAGTPVSSASVAQATAGQGKAANAEVPRPVVRSQAKGDSAPVGTGTDDRTTPAQTLRAVTSTSSGGLERNGLARQDANDGSGPAGAKPFASEPSIAVGHSSTASGGFVQALVRAQPHANLGLAAARLDPSDQIAIQVQRALGAGSDRISIQLHPAELGRIEVKLDMSSDNALRVAISVDKPETFDLLQRDIRSLDRALQDIGIKTDSGTLSFDLRQQADNRQLGRHHQEQVPTFDSANDDGEPPAATLPANQRQAWHAGSIDLNV